MFYNDLAKKLNILDSLRKAATVASLKCASKMDKNDPFMMKCIPKEMLDESISNGLDNVIQQLTKEIGQSQENKIVKAAINVGKVCASEIRRNC